VEHSGAVGAPASPAPASAPLIYLVAGEPSGDVLGAKLMAALKRRAGERLRFAGIGGERMMGEGLRSLFPVTDIAVNGLVEVLPALPRVFRRLDEAVADVARVRPAVVVTIDAPGFCLRLADRVRPLGIPVIHYVAPQVWAWRSGRARKLGRHVDHLLALLPNEPELFTRYGLPTTYVGHPAIEDRALPTDGPGFRTRHRVPDGARIVVMTPGSRTHVLRRMLPVFAGAVRLLHRRRPDVFVVVAAVAATEGIIREAAKDWSFPHVVVADLREKRDAIAAASAALSMTGTGSLELAIADLPMVVGSRVSTLTAILAWLLVHIKYFSMPNLLLGREVVPEMLQFAATPARLAARLERLLDDPGEQAAQRAGFAELRALLGGGAQDAATPSDRAAAVVRDRIDAVAGSRLAGKSP
jgi:lipid-A-disaccharide synthase